VHDIQFILELLHYSFVIVNDHQYKDFNFDSLANHDNDPIHSYNFHVRELLLKYLLKPDMTHDLSLQDGEVFLL